MGLKRRVGSLCSSREADDSSNTAPSLTLAPSFSRVHSSFFSANSSTLFPAAPLTGSGWSSNPAVRTVITGWSWGTRAARLGFYPAESWSQAWELGHFTNCEGTFGGSPVCLSWISSPSSWSFSLKSCCTCPFPGPSDTKTEEMKWRSLNMKHKDVHFVLRQLQERLPWISVQVPSCLLLLWLSCFFYVYAASLSFLSARCIFFDDKLATI